MKLRGAISLLLLVLASGVPASARVQASQQTQRLHTLRLQREEEIDCRTVAELARTTARQLRAAAIREPLRPAEISRLREQLEQQFSALVAEHDEFAASLSDRQRAAVRDELDYMTRVKRGIQAHIKEIERTATPQAAIALRRHCTYVQRDLKDWSDTHDSIAKQLHLQP